MMTKPGKTGLARLIAATGYSMKGYRAAWKYEEAFRIEATLACLCVPLAFWVGRDLTHQLLLVVILRAGHSRRAVQLRDRSGYRSRRLGDASAIGTGQGYWLRGRAYHVDLIRNRVAAIAVAALCRLTMGAEI